MSVRHEIVIFQRVRTLKQVMKNKLWFMLLYWIQPKQKNQQSCCSFPNIQFHWTSRINVFFHTPKKKWLMCQCFWAINNFPNILRLLDVLPNFPFITSETIHDCYVQTWYIRVASRVTDRLRKLWNIRKVSKPHRMIAQCPVALPKWKSCQY